MADTRDRMVVMNQWQDWANLVLAVWLFISPWVLGFASMGAPAGNAGASAAAPAASVPAWNAWIFGVVIAILSIAALVQIQPWEEWVNLAAGAWVFISPWVLSFSGDKTALWNALIVGALVFILAGWDLTTMPQTAGRRA